ncbi:MAG: hypothetical protein OEP95_14615 [Myxococcales bacterium]|nr:hypothetical protein [Myxococcales bacterium]
MTRALLASSLILVLSACSTPVEPEPAPLEFDRRRPAVDAYLSIAEHRSAKGDLPGALAAADAAVRRAPTSGPARLARAKYLARSGDPAGLSEARESVDAIAAEHPDAPGLAETRATVALASGDPEAAWSELQPGLDANSSPTLHALAAEIQLARGDETAALDEADRALEANPAQGRALAARAVAHQRLGEDRAAELDARRGLRTQPEDSSLRLLLVETQLRLGKTRSAEGSLAQLPAAARSAHSERLAGAIARTKGDSAAARDAYERALSLEPGDTECLRALASLDIEEGESEAALARLANDSSSDGTVLRARALLAADRPNEAGTELRALLRAQPDLLEPWGLLPSTGPDTGSPEARAGAVWPADEISADGVPGALVLEALLSEGDSARAAALYDEALTRHPGLAVAANNRASRLLDTGEEPERALRLARTAHARSGGAPVVADTLARALLHAGEPDEALLVASRGLANADPRNEFAKILRARRALALEALGEDDEARAAADSLLTERRSAIRAAENAGSETPAEPPWLADAQGVLDRLAEPEAAAEPTPAAPTPSTEDGDADADASVDEDGDGDAAEAQDATADGGAAHDEPPPDPESEAPSTSGDSDA